MVGPSLTGRERARRMTRLQVAVIALVAGSGGLVSLYADASLPWLVGALAGGALAGAVLWRYLVWVYHDGTTRQGRDDEREKRERFK
jgi:uncharacterized membrane protein AbrB (regulator of aidB expression)